MGTANIIDEAASRLAGAGLPTEINRVRRGHTFYPSPKSLEAIPGLYETDEVEAKDKTIHLHYFTGGSDWLIAEFDPATGEAYGWARVNCPVGEWGYTYLPELEQIMIPGRRVPLGDGKTGYQLPIIVERDLHFAPRTFSQCAADLGL